MHHKIADNIIFVFSALIISYIFLGVFCPNLVGFIINFFGLKDLAVVFFPDSLVYPLVFSIIFTACFALFYAVRALVIRLKKNGGAK